MDLAPMAAAPAPAPAAIASFRPGVSGRHAELLLKSNSKSPPVTPVTGRRWRGLGEDEAARGGRAAD